MLDSAWEGSDKYLSELSMGVISRLQQLPGVQDINFIAMPPCDSLGITAWEQRYSTALPQALKDFYLSSDGFRLQWNYNQVGHVMPLGIMNINRLGDLRRVAGLRYNFESEQPTLLDIEINTGQKEPGFGLKWKLFELDNCEGAGKVCLAFPPRGDGNQTTEEGRDIHVEFTLSEPQVWLLDKSFDWHFLANDFRTYFRMMVVHLGLPQWQMRYTSMGPAPWALGLHCLLAPHLDQPQANNQDFPENVIDPAVFKMRSRSKKLTGASSSRQEGPKEESTESRK